MDVPLLAVDAASRNRQYRPVLSFDEMPEDNADLADVDVDFARLPDDSAACCPVSMEEVLEYLAMEAPDGESLQGDDLEFLRTARVEDTDYWIWSFSQPGGQPTSRCPQVQTAPQLSGTG